MDKNVKILITGGTGMVGGAIVSELQRRGYRNLVATKLKRSPAAELSDAARWERIDLCDAADTGALFSTQKPDAVFLAAARVGGILANDSFSGDFILENLRIQTNVIDAARRHGVKKLLFLGSSCIYPRDCPQPIREEYLLTGPLEPTNEAYAVAKIAGIKMCESFNKQYGTNFFSVMPTNLYGERDNFDLRTSHVVPALIRKFHEAVSSGSPSVTLWGSGEPRREFLHVDDLAAACAHMMEIPSEALKDFFEREKITCLNIGTGSDLSVRELAEKIACISGYSGTIEWDRSKPDGTPRKVSDVSRVNSLGWHAKIALETGLRRTYAWYLGSLNSQANPKRVS